MPPRAWHSGVRAAVDDDLDPLQPSDLDGTDGGFDLFSQPPDEASPASSIQDEPNTDHDSANCIWRCLKCDSSSSVAVSAGWRCSDCGHGSFYRQDRPTKKFTDAGTWMFVPHAVSPSSSSSRRRRRRKQRPAGGDSPSGSLGSGEMAESEHPTVDPVVDPDAPQDHVTLQPNLTSPRRHPNVSGQQDLLDALKKLEPSQSSRLPLPSSSNSRPSIAVPKSKSKTALGKAKSKSSSNTTARPSAWMPDEEEVHHYNQPEFFDMGEAEENMTLFQAHQTFDPIYLPENHEQLQEIIRQGQEASRLLEEARQMGIPTEDMETEWGMPNA
eukprot:Skav234756  [mRNA]  locus=scaffold2327:10167:13368:+ [translate_table: standard]